MTAIDRASDPSVPNDPPTDPPPLVRPAPDVQTSAESPPGTPPERRRERRRERQPAAAPMRVLPDVRKVIVAVHGVGDQYSFATIQSVVNRFCGYRAEPAAVPLGSFYGEPVLTLAPPHDPSLACFAFAEVYWAKYPRELVQKQYTLEESRRWARTIVERLRLRAREEHQRPNRVRQGAPADARVDYRLLREVLEELIQTIAVADRLCALGEKAGLFSFDLRKLLDDYLGDVQVVAEFKTSRDKILRAFATTMQKVHMACPNADIHIVAHSEGTVVSFLGLLDAFRADPAPAWTTHVRGLMTLGSPIDKHLTLWPQLFAKPTVPRDPPRATASPRIEWRNYYDYGDPIGFKLDDARRWLTHHGWNGVFKFKEGHDVGFTRYPFPGKAHVDYWNDDAVFGHFIEDVVLDEPIDKRRFSKPTDRPLMTTVSYVLPYLGVALLMALAAYVLYKAINGAVAPAAELPPGAVWPGDEFGVTASHVMGLAALLLGVTVLARLPRLARARHWWALAAAAGAAGASLFVVTITRPADQVGMSLTYPLAIAAAGTALALGGLAAAGKWRLRTLIASGTAVTVLFTALHFYEVRKALTGEPGPLWPLVLATLAFLYLWWLGTLFFDLTFVWHHYVRHSQLQERLRTAVGVEYAAEGTGATPG